MSEININGSIGYTYLINNNYNILVLADMHSKLQYCKDDSIFISDWMNKKTKSKILLEEVPRLGAKLKELWPDAPHTQKLKELYLNSQVIDGVDIRPFIIPFSWELLLESDINDNKKREFDKITLYDYMDLINYFFKLKHKHFIKTLGIIYTKEFLKTSKLATHFLNLKKESKQLMKDNKKLLNKNIEFIINRNDGLMDKINELTSFIMEWYIIAKIFQGIQNNENNFIIHAGLAHTSNIILLLQKVYDYKIHDLNGINNYDSDKYHSSNGCLKLPTRINDLFGGDYGIY
jgi:ERCC4-related helicase